MTEPGIVPFGKYKGRPIEYMLADRSYCEWLAAQPWFRDRFAPVYNIIIGAGTEPQDSPEHNAMQARFLDHHEALRLAERWLATADALHAEWMPKVDRLTAEQRANLAADVGEPMVTDLVFEAQGWDVVLRAARNVTVTELAPAPPEWSEAHSYTTDYDRARWAPQSIVYVAAELKPVVGDDYPSVLREVLKRRRPDCMDSWRLRTYDERERTEQRIVLADRVEFSTVTLDQVRRIFASQNVTFLTTAELATGLRCYCPTCGPA